MLDIVNDMSTASDLGFLKNVPYTLSDSLLRLYESGSGDIAIMLAEVANYIKNTPAADTVEIEKHVDDLFSKYTVSRSGTLQEPIYLTYVAGRLTLLSGDAAQNWLDTISLDIDAYVKPPELVLVSADYVPYNPIIHINSFVELHFAASVVTEVGESKLSNVVSLNAGMGNWTSVTLDVKAETVSELATGIRYYRMFNGVFRLVAEGAL